MPANLRNFFISMLFISVTGAAHGVTTFSDDFASGTLSQWVAESEWQMGEGSVICWLDNNNEYSFMHPTVAMDAGAYQIDFDVAADATEIAQIWLNIIPTSDPSSFSFGDADWYASSDYFYLTPVTGETALAGLVTTANIVPPSDNIWWYHVTATFTAPESAFFVLGSSGMSYDFLMLDNVNVVGIAVPEPTTLVLVGLGLLGLITKRLHRRIS